MFRSKKSLRAVVIVAVLIAVATFAAAAPFGGWSWLTQSAAAYGFPGMAITSPVSSGPVAAEQDNPETLIEKARALAAESEPSQERSLPLGSVATRAPEGPNPLFAGVDDITIPAALINVTNSSNIPAFSGFQVWGAAYDAVNNKVYFNNGGTLYEWPVGGSVTSLGTIVDAGGASQAMVGLAFYNGTLYGTKNIANEAIWSINTTTLVATVVIDYADADFDCGGFDVDPNTGTFYCTNDDATPFGLGLFRMNPDGTGTLIAPYPTGRTDIDGLAVSNDGKAYMVEDDAAGPIHVWDFVGSTYLPPLTTPWPTSEVFSAGAWITPAGGPTPTPPPASPTPTPTPPPASPTPTPTPPPATPTPTPTPPAGCAGQTFPASGLPVAIPDSNPAGVPLTITVSGLTGTLTSAQLRDWTWGPAHSWGGDIKMTLQAPSGGPTATIVERRGQTTCGTGFGSSDDLVGPYNFGDIYPTNFHPDGVPNPVPAGDYFASQCVTTPGEQVFLNTVFGGPVRPTADSAGLEVFDGMAPEAANGNWTLTVSDNGGGDTGTLSAANLCLVAGGGGPTPTPTPPPASPTPTPTPPPATPTPTPNPSPSPTCAPTSGVLHDNGGLATGTTTESGVPAPAGFQWSEVQHDTGNTTQSNTSAGFSCSVTGTVFRCADDFTVPAGETWTVDEVAIFAYQTGGPATNPFAAGTLQIWNGRPGDVGASVVFGDTTTNRITTVTDALMYRVFNTAVPPPGSAPGTTRRIWRVNLGVSPGAVLAPGTYWIDWNTQIGATTAHFAPSETVLGMRTVPGWNARQKNGATWGDALDTGNPASAPDVAQDFPFKVSGTSSGGGGCPTPTPSPGVTPTPTPTPPPATPTPTPNPSPSPTCPPGGSGSITTLPPNNGSGGIFLQLTPTSSALTVTSFDTPFAGAVGTSASVEVWTRPGPYAGFTTSSAGWTLTQTVSATTAGTTTNAPVVLTTPLNIPVGTTSIYLHSITTGAGIRYQGTGTTATTTFPNSDLTLFTDVSRTGTVPFAGTQFTPRAFSGNVNYTVAGGCATPSPTPPPATPTPTPPPATPTPSPGGTPEIRFGAQTYYCNESMNGVITLVRNFNTTGTNTVNLATSNGTAVGGAAPGAGIDYQNVNTNVTFLPTEASKNVNVPCYGDTLTEATETVNLTLSGPFTRPGGGDEDDGTTAAAPEVQNAVLNIIDTASAWRFTNPICVTLGGTADAYPAPITVPNGPASIAGMRVTLYDLSYTFPDHIDALLVGPGGQKFVMMGDAGGALPIPPGSPVTLSFRDIGPGVLPNSGPLVTGNFEPTTWETPVTNFPGPAPAGPYSEPGSTIGGTGTQTFAGNFGGTNANGVWNLWIRDDAGVPLAPEAISGCINGGWGLEFLSTTAANASISGRVLTADGRPIRNVTVTVTGNSLSAPRVVQTGSFGYYNFDDLRTGETYVITVQGRRYFFQMPSQIVSLTDNIADLNFIAVPDDSQNQ